MLRISLAKLTFKFFKELIGVAFQTTRATKTFDLIVRNIHLKTTLTANDVDNKRR
jgi:hypothetical protein